MAREIEDLVQATVTSTGTGAFVVSATPIAGYRTPAQAHAVGATFEYVAKAGAQWEVGLATLVDATHISRVPIRSSSGNALVDFTTAPTLYETVSGDYLRGADPLSLGVVASAGTGDYLLLLRADGTAARILVSNVGGATSTPPAVDNPPTLSAISASATGSTTATGSATTNETGGTIYWLFSTGSTAAAAVVKAGSSKAVTAIGAQTLPGTGLAASTPYYLHVLHRDTANQDSAVLSLGAPFTTQAAGTPAPTVTGVTVSPSTANVSGGGTVQLSATVAGTNSPSQGVNWTIAGGGSVSASGLVTAPAATGSAQTLTVTATSQQDGTTKGTATVTVAAAAQAITVNTPVAQTVGTQFNVTGTWTITQPAALDYRLSDDTAGQWTPAPAGVAINANGTFSFPLTPASPSAGRTVSVRDRTTLVSGTSGTYVVNAAPAAVTPVAYRFNGQAFTAMQTALSFGGGDVTTPGLSADFIIKTAANVAPVDADVDIYTAMATSSAVMPRPTDAEHQPAPAGKTFVKCNRLGAGNATYDGYYAYSNVYTYKSFGGGLAARYMWIMVFAKGADPATATPIFAAPYDGVHTGVPVAITVTA